MKALRFWIVALALAAFLVPTAPAHAYLDPATGSMILQVLLAGLAGALLFFRRIWAFLRGLFAAKDSEESSTE